MPILNKSKMEMDIRIYDLRFMIYAAFSAHPQMRNLHPQMHGFRIISGAWVLDMMGVGEKLISESFLTHFDYITRCCYHLQQEDHMSIYFDLPLSTQVDSQLWLYSGDFNRCTTCRS